MIYDVKGKKNNCYYYEFLKLCKNLFKTISIKILIFIPNSFFLSVMDIIKLCRNTSDIIPLYLPQQLFLKPIAKLTISLEIPETKIPYQAISNWDVISKLQDLIKPYKFTEIKSTNTTLDLIEFEAEVDNLYILKTLIAKINGKYIQISQFNDLLKLSAKEIRQNFPNKHNWDTFFKEAENFNGLKAGERPDTVHLSNLPIQWFCSQHQWNSNLKPSEKIFYNVFRKYGKIRNIDLPICDPYRKQMKSYTNSLLSHSFNEKDLFEGYIQFQEHNSFVSLVDEFNGKKLLFKNNDCAYVADIKIDFDRNKHMTDSSIRRREIVKKRLMKKATMKKKLERHTYVKIYQERKKMEDFLKEKEIRRKKREEKRKLKILTELKTRNFNELNKRIVREERKLIVAQRKLEAIRLLEGLFNRVKLSNLLDESVKEGNLLFNINKDLILKSLVVNL